MMPMDLERLHSLADRVPTDPELAGQVALRRQRVAGEQVVPNDIALDLLLNLMEKRRSFEGSFRPSLGELRRARRSPDAGLDCSVALSWRFRLAVIKTRETLFVLRSSSSSESSPILQHVASAFTVLTPLFDNRPARTSRIAYMSRLMLGPRSA